MSELDEIMNGKYEMRGFRIEGDTIGFDTPQSYGWNLNPRDIETIIYTLQQELERYKNIVDGMEKFFQYAYDNEVRPLNDRKVSVWTICLDKLKELKGE